MNEAPDIARLEACYARGDFREARKIAKALAAAEGSKPAERTRAAEILKATGADPVAIAAFVVTALLVVFLIVHYVL